MNKTLCTVERLENTQKTYVKLTQHHDHVERACSTPLTPHTACGVVKDVPKVAATALCGHKSAQLRSGKKICRCDRAQKVVTAAKNKRGAFHKNVYL